jgi:hypothetical protein
LSVSVSGWRSSEWLEDCAGIHSSRGGHLQSVVCRLATEEESAPVLAAEAAAAARKAAVDALSALARSAAAPTQEQLSAIPSAQGAEAAHLEWRIGADGVYILLYCGRDGDDWSLNNWGSYVVTLLPLERVEEVRALLATATAT